MAAVAYNQGRDHHPPHLGMTSDEAVETPATPPPTRTTVVWTIPIVLLFALWLILAFSSGGYLQSQWLLARCRAVALRTDRVDSDRLPAEAEAALPRCARALRPLHGLGDALRPVGLVAEQRLGRSRAYAALPPRTHTRPHLLHRRGRAPGGPLPVAGRRTGAGGVRGLPPPRSRRRPRRDWSSYSWRIVSRIR